MTGARLWEAISLRRGSLFSDTLVQNMLWAILVKLTGMANKNNQGEGLRFDDVLKGNVEKSRQRRSRPFAVLTYYEYAPRVKMAAALLDGLF